MSKKIEVIVRGEMQDKHDALVGLLQDATDTEVRAVVRTLDISTVTKLAMRCHGRMYAQLGVSCSKW